MRQRVWTAAAVAGVLGLAWACGKQDGDSPPPQKPGGVVDASGRDGGEGGTGGEGGGTLPDAGGGEDVPPPPPPPGPGPWPTDALQDWTATYGLPEGVQSVDLDEAHTLWLLRGEDIGVLRPGDTRPTWTRGVGQAAGGFSREGKAEGSTVICGGEAGRAYVGYRTYELAAGVPNQAPSYIAGPNDPGYDPARFEEFQKGDVDAVQLQPDGTVVLEEHLWRSAEVSGGTWKLGLRNSNDFHFDEDRSVLTCQRVRRGPNRGDVYLGTNHGVSLVRGLVFNSHRHPSWYRFSECGQPQPCATLMSGYTWGLGLTPEGTLLVANEWTVGILPPTPAGLEGLKLFDDELTFEGPVPWHYKGHNTALNPLEEFDYWRAFEQTRDGRHYLGSERYGLWRMENPARADNKPHRSDATYTPVPGLPTAAILALKATDDGALYVGTGGEGLWRLEPDGRTLRRVTEVKGGRVLQLVYEPTLSPSMLLVLTDAGLTVLRGP